MAARAERITVTTTRTLLTTPEQDHTTGSAALIKALTAGVLVGGPEITAATGYPLDQGEVVGVDLTSDTLYAITASGTGTVAVLRVGA